MVPFLTAGHIIHCIITPGIWLKIIADTSLIRTLPAVPAMYILNNLWNKDTSLIDTSCGPDLLERSHCNSRLHIIDTITMNMPDCINVYAILPTKSLCGPVSTAFQFQEVLDGQLVKPSWCLLVRTTYLQWWHCILQLRTRLLYKTWYAHMY